MKRFDHISMHTKLEKNSRWKGDDVSAQTLYVRAKRLYKAGKITEEEFQPYRDAWAELHRSIKRRSK